MELCDDFKSLFYASSSDSGRLPLGPLTFVPSPPSLTLLYSSSSLSPNLPPLNPVDSLSSFLDSSELLPSTSFSISSDFDDPNLQLDSSSLLSRNNFLLIRCPGSHSVLALFPTGENYDRIGFITLTVHGSKLTAEHGFKLVEVSSSKRKLCSQRILKLSFNPFPGKSNIGYLMACTMYGIQWYNVGFDIKGKPMVDLVTFKFFKSCVVDACWSPHIFKESLVLLESGELFLFDLDDCPNNENLRSTFSGTRLNVSGEEWGSGGWLRCEFSWHPRIVVVATSSMIFMLDFRGDECVTTTLLKIDTSSMFTIKLKDRFITLSKAGLEGFQFVVATLYRVILFDVRKVMMSLLQWPHSIPSPSYIAVFPLSDLRSTPEDKDCYSWASKSGNCILMGSFWENQFDVFCYGPKDTESNASKISKLNNSLCSWGHPWEISVSGQECNCGNCLLREDFWKESLPPWVDWRQKKEIVIGFGILDKDLGLKLSEQGGFTLIRLMSSGKIESQLYIPSHDLIESAKEPHKWSTCGSKDFLLFTNSEMEEYKFPKRFEYSKLDNLCAYVKDDLFTVLRGKVKDCHKVSIDLDCATNTIFHKQFCEKLNTCGLPLLSYAAPQVLFNSVHEVALSMIRAHFPDLPIPVLLTIHEFTKGNSPTYSAGSEIKSRCIDVLKLLIEIVASSSRSDFANQIDSLSGQNMDQLSKSIETMNDIRLKNYGSCTVDDMSEVSTFYDKNLSTFIYKTADKDPLKKRMKMNGPELFYSMSPIKLKFGGHKKLETVPEVFSVLKRQYTKFLCKYDDLALVSA